MAQAPAVTIQQEFAREFAGSLAMHQRARKAIAGGINHDGRFQKPFPLYIARARGALAQTMKAEVAQVASGGMRG